jgi:hypothetical protein
LDKQPAAACCGLLAQTSKNIAIKAKKFLKIQKRLPL